jgi:hypothetical protein
MHDPAPSARSDPYAALYAVIGRSDDEPVLYHMNLSWVRADSLRARREAATGRPCFVIPMAAWHHDAGAALLRAEQARFGTP